MTVARVTGWPEREILWEIPLARLVQYVHAVWSYDATVIAYAVVGKQKDKATLNLKVSVALSFTFFIIHLKVTSCKTIEQSFLIIRARMSCGGGRI